MLRGIVLEFADGEIIFREGDAAADMFFIRSGQVRVSRTLDDGAERVYAILGPGEFFGEIALFDPGPRSATAVAVGPVRAEAVDRPSFMEALQTDPAAKEILAEMSARIRQLQEG